MADNIPELIKRLRAIGEPYDARVINERAVAVTVPGEISMSYGRFAEFVAELEAEQAPKRECTFVRAWAGKCGQRAVVASLESDHAFCTEHLGTKCWCGAQATHQCSVASSFVCGAPLCPIHECSNVAGGLTGSSGYKHSETGYRQHQEWKARTTS